MLLVEQADRVLTAFPPSLSERARRSLQSLGVTQFNIYLMHDAMDETLAGYGESVIPNVNTAG